MKIVCKGTIREMRDISADGTNPVDQIALVVDVPSAGATVCADKDARLPSGEARRATVRLTIGVRSIVAEQLRFGQPLYITIDTDEPARST